MRQMRRLEITAVAQTERITEVQDAGDNRKGNNNARRNGYANGNELGVDCYCVENDEGHSGTNNT